ncbi:MAG: gliding motility lipoprotein GldH [Algoriphagus sp.]|uniref:gliding motility lipoprotein GldH n=1 Tax=Algoriphagus sp. TaxID=1872435 RepID=UPI0017CF7A1D|nr:gliding motility lipoprotein GldH [Algoriphagus sp.]NVJ85846.1 gliding motility lipoprotein GldH [Algoriphagus sp.]
MNRLAFPFLVLSILLFSCTDNRLYESYESISPDGWGMSDSLVYDISSLTEKPAHTLIGVRYKDDYPYSNCYIRLLKRDSTHTILEDKLIDITLFDSKGEPLGEGFGSTYTVYDSITLEVEDQVNSLVLLQYMREEQLKGIEAVGIKFLKK